MKNLLKDTGIKSTDAARLILEALEALGKRANGLTHGELMQLLRHVMNEGVRGVTMAEQTVSFEEAAWASIHARSNRRAVTLRDLRNYVRRMLRVEGVSQLPLRSMQKSDCLRILQKAFGSSNSSYRKGRTMLHSIFSYGIRQEWCDSNPVARIEVPRVQEKAIVPLKADEIQRLKQTVEQPRFRDMKLSLSLLLYSGIRPTEVSRLHAEDICWKEHVVFIRSQTSKTGGGRSVSLHGFRGIRREERIIPRNWQKKWRELRRAAGFTKWVADSCRHTFATYHATYHRDLPTLQLEMGHRNASLLLTRYTMPARRQDAAYFWQHTAFSKT